MKNGSFFANEKKAIKWYTEVYNIIEMDVRIDVKSWIMKEGMKNYEVDETVFNSSVLSVVFIGTAVT